MITITLKSNRDLRRLRLPYSTLADLAREVDCANPEQELEAFLVGHQWKGELTLDASASFVAFN